MKNLYKAFAMTGALLLMGACSNGEDGSGDKEKTYKVSYSTWANPGEPAYEGMEEFKEIVEEKTDGNMKIELFPANQLGATAEQMEQLKLGSIEMMSSGDPGMLEMEYLSLPYLMASNEHWAHVLESEIGQGWNETLVNDMGVRNIGILPRGPRVISANEPIKKPEDLKGIKLRVPARDYYVETFKTLGANPTPMDFGELYSGLQTGVVEGQENPLETFYASGFQEVQKYVILSNHMYKPAFVTVNEEFFKGLPEEYQTIIVDAAYEAQLFAEEKLEEEEKTMREEIEQAGVEFIEPDIEAFDKATQSVRDELGKKLWGDEVYQQVVEMGKEDL